MPDSAEQNQFKFRADGKFRSSFALSSSASLCLTEPVRALIGTARLNLYFAPVGGIAPPSVFPHWLPLLRTCELRCAPPFRTAFCGGGQYRPALGHSSPPHFATLFCTLPFLASLWCATPYSHQWVVLLHLRSFLTGPLC